MTPAEYESRIKALGFAEQKDWSDYIGIDRTTHYRHLNREDDVPQPYCVIVRLLEACPELNPNKLTAPWPDYVGNPIKDGDVIKHPSGKTGVVTRVAPTKEPEAALWRVNYGGAPLSRLCLVVGGEGKAVVV